MQASSSTKQRKPGLVGGPTNRGLQGGVSKSNTGVRGSNTRTKNYTRGGTTSESRDTQQDNFRINALGEKVNIIPKPLFVNRKADKANEKAGDKAGETKAGETETKESKQAVPKPKDMTESQQSGTSSLLETSEDEEQKKKEAEKAKKELKFSPAQLAAEIPIVVSESQTITLFYIPGIVVAGETPEFATTEKSNKSYKELCEKKVTSDAFIEHGSQTMNLTQKTREIDYQGFTQESKSNQATNWDIDDARHMERVSDAKRQEMEYLQMVNETLTERSKHRQAFIDAENLASHISIGSETNSRKTGNDKTQSGVKSGTGVAKNVKSSTNLNQSQTSEISDKSTSQTHTNPTSTEGGTQTGTGAYAVIKKNAEYVNEELPESIMKAIKIIERLLTQNAFHEQHVLYKNYPPVKLANRNFADEDEEGQTKGRKMGMKKETKKEDEDKKEEEEVKEGTVTLKPLFTFECDITEGRQVSCIDINQANPDLVAVGYGEYDINCIDDSKLKPGLLCFWTLKNPNFPEKLIVHDSSITCCQFSKKQPHLVAIGDSSGNIAIYNVRGTDLKPIAESKDLDFKHTDIVWDIQWVQRENKGESLVSISGDGKIIEWSLRKGLEYTELMQLKRETNPNQKDVYAGAETEKKGGGMTFINTGGLSIDFPAKDESNITYFTATEDCTIHMCSMSYSEQTLETYSGHTGPIYRVRCNPFWHKDDCPVFLTCSYDWTVRVWNAKQQQPKLTCHQIETLKEQVNDINWSPSTSSVFGSVANDGRIEIWDLKRDVLAPVLTHFDKDAQGNEIHTPKTAVRFSRNSPVVLAGTETGKVGVYRTIGLEHVQVSERDQINRLLSAITKDEYESSNQKSEE